ncbi:DUF2867 domain-containing protein [Amycolatopsis sp. H20-H5]|uniref:DUF2867 domain-containing protein n=1 Tax=Amycolatopsis sp. H20-H5 TaxID=3046309 RepID=UPI002DBB22DF|nr:DUF2867 domain-containing protein [Amycolatopsis sp. H20-H5]MEC3979499.1 DUF2867 domain-containing protein [Amycolatopsis sp. H20-H5]
MNRVLVLGATGYIGTRLVPRLVSAGYDVRCLVRTPAKVRLPSGCAEVEIVTGDVLDPAAVRDALREVDVVYHLVHSLAERDFQELDATAASLVTEAAAAAGARRIVYLGGLRPAEDDERPASRHLASRAEVGDLFLRGRVPAVVLQASVIVGSGSTSYELLRYLTESAPVLPLPAWADNPTQPIAVSDVLHYLAGCAELPPEVNREFDIGGPDVLSYRQMIQRYGRTVGLFPRFMPTTPMVSPALLARLVEQLTPVSAAVAEPLIESLAHPLVCRDNDIVGHVGAPPGGPLTFEDAVRAAMVCTLPDPASAEQPRNSALPHPGDLPGSGGPAFVDEREFISCASAERVWETSAEIGGESGWYSPPLVERVQGLVSRLAGAGELVAPWRVESVDAVHRRVILRSKAAEPGQTWLELSVSTTEKGETQYRQRLVFRPSGARGQVYWLALRPIHEFLHSMMAQNVVLVAQRESSLLAPVGRLLGSLGRWPGRVGLGATG